jgi:polyisoprenoid-binding protein YceI
LRRKALVQTLTLALLLPLSATIAMAEPAVYKVDPDHSGVNFTIRHFVSNISGRFKDFDGVVKYDKANPAATTTCAPPTSSTWRSSRP